MHCSHKISERHYECPSCRTFYIEKPVTEEDCGKCDKRIDCLTKDKLTCTRLVEVDKGWQWRKQEEFPGVRWKA